MQKNQKIVSKLCDSISNPTNFRKSSLSYQYIGQYSTWSHLVCSRIIISVRMFQYAQYLNKIFVKESRPQQQRSDVDV